MSYPVRGRCSVEECYILRRDNGSLCSLGANKGRVYVEFIHVDNPSAEVFLKERTLNAGPNDSAFLTSLRWSLNTLRGISTVYQDFKDCQIPVDLAGCLNTLPVPIPKWDCPFRVRFVFAHGVDNSGRPSYLLWPCRGNGGHFWLVDPWSGSFFDPTAARFLAPIGLDFFFFARWLHRISRILAVLN